MTRKIAIVTGAARGIGLATTKQFLTEGKTVVMVDVDVDELAAAASALSNVDPRPIDITDGNAVADMIADVRQRHGRIDHLVNNAGIAEFGPLEETDFEMWRRVMDVNLDAIFRLTQAATPALRETKGSIVNIASISGLRASTLRVAYGTSKRAVMHLTEQQALELGQYGIRANCVAPGPVRTKLAMAVHTQDIIDTYHDHIPLNRYGEPEEIAAAICFLCSDAASYVTGQTLAVDGGFGATGVGLPALRG